MTIAATPRKHPADAARQDAYRAGQVARTTAEQRGHYQRGLALARQALARDPDDPAGLLWYAANLGAEALLRGKLRALPVVGDIERVLLQLERVHPEYDGAAAARSLGRLYHQAPAIISVGSSRKAAEYLGQGAGARPRPPRQPGLRRRLLRRPGRLRPRPPAAGAAAAPPGPAPARPRGRRAPGHRPRPSP